ncbi:MAG: M4 family metallopeptidase, partial [Prolixibacteraceae bacterium]|nr:M4 family metallopeptidase [Prolixibacteraceae bacterium]
MKSSQKISNEERFFQFFEESKSITRIDQPKESFKINSIVTDDLGITHFKSVQLYRGIEIYGTESSLHFNNKKERFTGRIATINKTINNKPSLPLEDAIERTFNDLKKITVCKELKQIEKQFLNYKAPLSKLVFFKGDETNYKLAYEIEVRPNFIEVWKYFIDANSGRILRKFNATTSDGPATAQAYDLNDQLRSFNTFLENNEYILADLSQPMYDANKEEGMIFTLDANNTSTKDLDYSVISSTNNAWNNPKAISAHANTTAAYEYFYNTFGRNSINGNGGNIISFINVANDDGASMANAFWNGEAAYYGNGGGIVNALSGGLDIVAHELGHGVVGTTANLEYFAQSGAINETYADIFGCMVDRNDWLVGEDVTNGMYFPSGATRNMADPNNQGAEGDYWWQPNHLSDMVLGEEDNAGVHSNSGIGNYAYYNYARAVSKDKAEQVFYRALTNYLTKSSQFIDLRIAVIQSAIDKYGDNSTEVNEARKSFDIVGIYGEDPVVEIEEYEVNNGEDFLLSYNTDLTYSSTLYRTNVNGEDFIPYTTTGMISKPSVVDDGSFAIFVDEDHYMKYITLDPDYSEEDILLDLPYWDNVAVSKDGNRVAAISTDIDTSIYILDLVNGDVVQFVLYNPTTSHENTNAGGVLYADAIEFDISGEYLIYDAYNEMNSTTSEDISYWDIGIIHVWDNQKNDFGTGHIEKLFNTLPEGASVGNPVFSKNSPNIVAFDYFDSEDVAVIGADIQSGDIDVVYENSILGYPSFSKNDDKIAFSAESTTDTEVVAAVNLADNKISAVGDNAYVLVSDAKWPVFYSTGVRELGLDPIANFTADYLKGKAPFEVQFVDLSKNSPTSWYWEFVGGNPSESLEQNPVVSFNSIGKYEVTLTVSNNFGNNTIIKSNYIEVDNFTSIDLSNLGEVSIFPNPATDLLSINSPDLIESYSLLNMNGKKVRYALLNQKQFQLKLSGLSKG